MRPLESFVSQPIRSLQTMLRLISTAEGRQTSIIPDGIYGSQTMSVVSDFQRKRGLPVTGVTNRETWDVVVREYNQALVQVDAAQPIEIVLNPNQVIHKNEHAPNVYLAQGMLTVLSEVYSSISAPTMTGTIDLPTSNALESFQVLANLPMTGELDKMTWKHLALHYPMASNLRQSRKYPR